MAEIIEMRRVKPRFEPVYDPLKNCSTCGHRAGLNYSVGRCMLSGHPCTVERRYPTVCGVHFENWTARPPSRWQRFKKWLRSGVSAGAPTNG